MAVLAVVHNEAVIETPYLLAVMNTLFLGIIPVAVAYIASRVYLRGGSLTLLLLGSGILVFGLGSILAGWVNVLPGGPNMTVTIHNTCSCIGAAIIMAGVMINHSVLVPSRGGIRTATLAALYTGMVALVLTVTLPAVMGVTPPFFIPGSGPTMLRQIILENAVLFFAISSALLMSTYLRRRTDLFFWFSVSFALIAIGLLAVFFQPSVGSPMGWAGRSAQDIGCVLALYGVLIARKTAMTKGISLETAIAEYFVDAGERFKELVETAPVAIISFDKDCRILLWNPAAWQMFGYTPGEAVGASFSDIIFSGEDAEEIRKACRAMQIGSTYASQGAITEREGRRKDGTPVFVVMSLAMQEYPPGWIGTAVLHDITSRKQAEKALQASESLLNEVGEIARVGGWEIEVATMEIRWTDQTYRIHDIPVKEKADFARAISFFDMPGRDTLKTAVSRCIQTGEPYDLELPFTSATGRHLWTQTIGKAVLEEGRIVRLKGTFQDISDRKRAEEALRETKEYLENLISHANAPIITWDRDFRITEFNHAFEDLTGLSRNDVLGQDLSTLFPDENRKDSMDLIRRTSSGERFVVVEIPIRHVSGKTSTVLWNSANITRPNGEIIATIAQGQDITERKRAEVALRQANRQLNLLSSITRHDISNKLIVALGYISAAEMEFPDPALVELLGKIESAMMMIGSQIEFTRVYQDLGIHEPQWQGLGSVLPRSQVPKTVMLDAGVQGFFVYADPMLEKVFSNLLDNSIRHGEHVTGISVSCHRSPGDLTVVWEDDGVGIADWEKERIFERGYGKNTGLGMFLAREILTITGITIIENGEPGKGARFVITVPKGAWRYSEDAGPGSGPS